MNDGHWPKHYNWMVKESATVQRMMRKRYVIDVAGKHGGKHAQTMKGNKKTRTLVRVLLVSGGGLEPPRPNTGTSTSS